jgi:hypothetical protein
MQLLFLSILIILMQKSVGRTAQFLAALAYITGFLQ